jgi:hypothetical protein
MFEYLAIKPDTPRPLTEAEFIADTSCKFEHPSKEGLANHH